MCWVLCIQRTSSSQQSFKETCTLHVLQMGKRSSNQSKMLNSGMGVKIPNLDSKSCPFFRNSGFELRSDYRIHTCLPPLPYVSVPCCSVQQQKQDRLHDCSGLCPALWLHKSNSSYRSGSHLTVSGLINDVITVLFGASCFSFAGTQCMNAVFSYPNVLMWRGNHYMSVGIWRIKTCWRETLIFQSEKSKGGVSISPTLFYGNCW